MFTKFYDFAKYKRIKNCKDENSLTNILYLGGLNHTTNIKNFIEFLVTKNDDLIITKHLFEENVNLAQDNNIHIINLPKEILEDFKYDLL